MKYCSEKSYSDGMQILQIAGVGDMYGALNEYTEPTTVTLQEGVAQKRILFESLPEVLFFPLQRLNYSNSGAAGKKTDAFDFPRRLFMDRYLHENMQQADEKRYYCSITNSGV